MKTFKKAELIANNIKVELAQLKELASIKRTLSEFEQTRLKILKESILKRHKKLKRMKDKDAREYGFKILQGLEKGVKYGHL